MLALITGASSGIGREMAKILSDKGVDLILVARREDKLIELKNQLKTNCEVISLDLGVEKNCYELYNRVKGKDIDILINNAGFGVFGKFEETDLNREIDLIKINVIALHILTKLFYKDFMKKNKGYILNVASSAGFIAGPLLSSYYASKNYVVRLTQAISEEIRREKKNVSISVLCPGPVDTEFNSVAGTEFSVRGITATKAAQCAIDGMFKRKLKIIPALNVKLLVFSSRFTPDKLMLRLVYKFQKKKENS